MSIGAPGTTAPEESRTVPSIEPCVVDCAFKDMELKHTARMRSARHEIPRRILLNVITALQSSRLRLNLFRELMASSPAPRIGVSVNAQNPVKTCGKRRAALKADSCIGHVPAGYPQHLSVQIFVELAMKSEVKRREHA